MGFNSAFKGLKLNLGRTEIITKRRSLTGTLSFVCCLTDLRSASLTSFLSGFRKRFIVDFSSNAITILFLFFPTLFYLINYETRFLTQSAYFFQFHISLISLTFSSTLKPFFAL